MAFLPPAKHLECGPEGIQALARAECGVRGMGGLENERSSSLEARPLTAQREQAALALHTGLGRPSVGRKDRPDRPVPYRRRPRPEA